MSSTDRAEVLALNLERLVPDEPAMLKLARAAAIPVPELRGILAANRLPCPRTMGRLAAALHTTPATLYQESPDA